MKVFDIDFKHWNKFEKVWLIVFLAIHCVVLTE